MEPQAKIAVIEDHDDNRELMLIALSEWYLVASYRDGKSGLKGIQEDCPDLVLIDIGIPDMSGVAILKAMRSSSILYNVPTIAVTADAMQREKFLEAGFDDYLAKPYDLDALHLAIEAQLHKARKISN